MQLATLARKVCLKLCVAGGVSTQIFLFLDVFVEHCVVSSMRLGLRAFVLAAAFTRLARRQSS